MKKDAFYYSGFVNQWDGRCTNCPYRVDAYDGSFCEETLHEVNKNSGYINHECPFIQKGELE